MRSDDALLLDMRNRLVHGYFSIRLDVIWLTAQVDIPPLRNLLETIVLPEDKFEDEDRAV